jgi:arylsulfatase A-like enzyme
VEIEPGDEFRTYTVPAPLRLVAGEQTRHILVSPTDVEGAGFEIESLRVIFVEEHLATLSSGAGWYGLQEIYHDALALRAEESIHLTAPLPPGSRLFAELGTLAAGPVRFRIALERAGAEPIGLLERTLTTSGRWERVQIDLGEHAGAQGRLVFAVDAEQSPALGFFGNPVLRPMPEPSGDAPRGVILILADTLRRDHLDSYGYARETAPRLARVASEGARFRDVVAQGSWTKVSTPSIVTGRYQSSHGVTKFASRLPDAALTLAEIFREAGYATLAYSSVFFTGKFSNMQQGYESFHELNSLPDSSTKTSRAYVDRLLGWLDDHRDVPFFVFLHVFDPHDPFEPRPPYDTLWADPGRREQQLREVDETRPFIKWPFMQQRGLPNPEELVEAGFDPEAHVQHNRDWYDGSIRGMDSELGRVFEKLAELDLAGDVVVAFTADHGEEFFEHGSVFHGRTLYGEMIDVPLVFWGPGRVPQGVQVDTTVQSIDVLPTLLELSKLPLPEGVQGRSLAPLMRGAEWTPRPAVAEAWGDLDGPPSPQRAWDRLAIVSKGWKLVHNLRRPDGAAEFELYHRERDPLDQLELSESFPAQVERLRGEIDAWRTWVDATRLESDGEAGELSPEELERLRELGYVQ